MRNNTENTGCPPCIGTGVLTLENKSIGVDSVKKYRKINIGEIKQLESHVKSSWNFFILCVVILPVMLFIFFLIDKDLNSLSMSFIMGYCFIIFLLLVCWREARNVGKDLCAKNIVVVNGTITKYKPLLRLGHNIEVDGKDMIKFDYICLPVFRKGDKIEITRAPISKRIIKISLNGIEIYKLSEKKSRLRK